MWKEVRSDDCNQKFRYCIGAVDRWFWFMRCVDFFMFYFARVWQADGYGYVAVLSGFLPAQRT